MSEIGSGQKISDLITLVLALVFIGVGISVISGIFFADRVLLEGTIKYVFGFVLIGYGIFRITVVGGKFKRKKGK